MTRRLNIFITLTTAALTCTSARLLQAQAEETPENFQGAGSAPDFQEYVFFAYGITCLLLFLFTLRTISQCRNLQKRVDYLEERFKEANPGGQDDAGGAEI